jgi:LacI family transcriptional regulator
MTKTRRVAVAIDLSFPLRHHHDVFSGVQRYAREHAHWECVVQPFIRTLRKGRGETDYHGIVARATVELAQQAATAGVPVVNVWAGTPAKTLPSVLPDFEACGRMAAEHLLDRGFRQFAFQGFLQYVGTPLALAGFKSALRAAECRCTTRQIISPKCDEDAQSWERYMSRLERWIGGWKPPLGVFVMLDIFSRYLANACLHAGLRIPEDVALIGVGNEPVICAHPEPSLSSFDVGYERVGYEAAALLDRLMDGKSAPTAPILVEPAGLVVRRSTDAYVVDNPEVAAALRFVAEHSHEAIRVDDVARHVHATVRSLRRHFHAATGRTITNEIARLRLERAKRLLVESKEPIKQVSRDCGFADAAYFHRVFLQAEGVSPGEYRRRRGKPGAKPP